MSYVVRVADNFHYMDDDESYSLGAFETLELALEQSQRIVDEYLAATRTEGMTAQELYESYQTYGEDPYILSWDIDAPRFSAWNYAKARCEELCGKRVKEE